jgi:uncharacterized protein YcfJ
MQMADSLSQLIKRTHYAQGILMKISSITIASHAAKQGLCLVGALGALSFAQGAWADSSYAEAEVVAVSPRYETVTYSEPREECHLERIAYSDREQRSGTPRLVGALIGGALGNALGAKRPNKQVGAVVGGLLGYSIGKDMVRHKRHHEGAVRYRQEQVCEVFYDRREERQLTGYDVTYAYAGRTYQALLDEHPGDTLRVKVRIRPI